MNKNCTGIILCLLLALAFTQEEGNFVPEGVNVTDPSVICSLVPQYSISSVGDVENADSTFKCDCEYDPPISGGYYYDVTRKECVEYSASCCGVASPNTFETYEECSNLCQGVQPLSTVNIDPTVICGNSPTIRNGPLTQVAYTFVGMYGPLTCQEVNISASTVMQNQNLFESLSICEQFCEPYYAAMFSDDIECDTESFLDCYTTFNATTNVCTAITAGTCMLHIDMFNSDASGCVCPSRNEGEEEDAQEVEEEDVQEGEEEHVQEGKEEDIQEGDEEDVQDWIAIF